MPVDNLELVGKRQLPDKDSDTHFPVVDSQDNHLVVGNHSIGDIHYPVHIVVDNLVAGSLEGIQNFLVDSQYHLAAAVVVAVVVDRLLESENSLFESVYDCHAHLLELIPGYGGGLSVINTVFGSGPPNAGLPDGNQP